MAKSLRRKSGGLTTASVTGKKVDGNARRANCNNRVAETPQIQELQNLMDLQNEKLNTVKTAYIQQNSQLAKTNSLLLIKLNELEKKISELVQENILLRSRAIMSEHHYKERLDQYVKSLEDGVLHRFEEMFYMFDNIRSKESLPFSNTSKNMHTLRSNKRKSSIQKLQRDDSISNTMKSNDEPLHNSPKRRRKSSRRDSFILPSNSKLSYLNEDEEGQQIQTPHEEIHNDIIEETQEETPEELPEENLEASPGEAERDNKMDQQNSIHIDNSFNFTNSIIEYSIPEESMQTNSISENEQSISTSSSQKIEVFRDEPVESAATNTENVFIQLPSQNKIKHSMKHPRPRNNSMDETMPISNTSMTDDLDSAKNRRTRGKTVNYKLPSLRAKMRRPTEKFVDATTVTNIKDLQVNGKYKKKSKSENDDLRELCSPSSEVQIIHSGNESVNNNTDANINIYNNILLDQNIDEDVLPINTGQNAQESKSTFKTPSIIISPNPIKDKANIIQKEFLKTILKTSGKEKIKVSLPSLNSKVLALKDITNTNKGKPLKTKKLFKKAIINNLSDENSGYLGESSPYSSSSDSSSFRLNEEDLSVFDFMRSNKNIRVPKTYRANAKKGGA